MTIFHACTILALSREYNKFCHSFVWPNLVLNLDISNQSARSLAPGLKILSGVCTESCTLVKNFNIQLIKLYYKRIREVSPE